MRKQVVLGRFGLAFGAGLSKGFGIPTWDALVAKLASDPDVHGEEVLQTVPPRAGLPYKTEMLFAHFRQLRYANESPDAHHTRTLDYRIGAEWRAIVRKHLYSTVTGDINHLLDSHPYFKHYLPLIQNSPMTVTYNFDDFIERALLSSRNGTNAGSRGFESVTNPWSQFRHNTAVIYHPNGVVPQNILESPSDRFVFSEASYAEQLMGIFAGDQAGLISHLSKHTCLLIGLSLEDDTLRNVLMQAARACPGNFHYYVHYVKPGETLDEEKQRAITHANFKVYNLVTLFLNDDEIRALGELLNTEEYPKDAFCDLAQQHGIRVRFRFYITGPLGVGKSTTINYFRNLVVLDEWLDQRPDVLAKDWKTLTPDETQQADQWIANQFKLKNDILRNEREGIFLMDRGPLDPVAFTPDTEWNNKAQQLLTSICPGHATWSVEDGRVILLQGESNELALRMILTQREDYTADKLREMEGRLTKVYGTNGVTRFDSHGLTPSDVARRIAEIIHLEQYTPICNLKDRLDSISKDGTNVN